MSDVSQGEGWWIASDGKWYPPELHPDVRQDPRPAEPAATGPAVPAWPDTTRSAAAPTGPAVVAPSAGTGSTTWFSATAGSVPAAAPRRRWLVPAVVAATVVVAAGIVAAVVTTGGGPGWSDTSFRVVGSPVLAGGRVLVLDVDAGHQLEQAGVDPADGQVVWRHRFSASAVTAGVGFGPTVIGPVALQLTPAGAPSDPTVKVQGLDAANGVVLWTLSQDLVVVDAPAVCAGGHDFCLATTDQSGTSGLVVLDPASGAVAGVVYGPVRNMTVPLNGEVNAGTLWQTDDQTPTFTQVAASGQRTWTKTVASLFGAALTPDNGWDFETADGLDVGTVAVAATGATAPAQDSATVGIRVADGTVAWQDPGMFDCGGGLDVLAVAVLCRFPGPVSTTARSPVVAGTLEGFDWSTGRQRWQVPVGNLVPLVTGDGVVVADATHLVVRGASGHLEVLDTATGATAAPAAGAAFWCEHVPTFTVPAAAGTPGGGERAAMPVFSSCTAAGAPAQGLPATDPTTVGVRAGGLFIWPTQHGLRAAAADR